MQFKLCLVAFAALIASVTAAPAGGLTGVVARALQKRVDGHVYVCTDDEWSGDCTDYGFSVGICSNFPSEFQDDISSVGPDQGFTCNFYIDYNCNNDQGSFTLTYPGVQALGYGNDAVSSMICYYD